MSSPVPANERTASAEAVAPISSIIQVRLEDTLAARNRLWIRGRVESAAESNGDANGRSWWKKWSSKNETPAQSEIQLETRVGGSVVTASVPLAPDGSFEVKLTLDLPPARRGWRVARNRVALGTKAIDACNVILLPPPDASAAVVVLLPLKFPAEVASGGYLTKCKWAGRLPDLIRSIQQPRGRHNPIYYIACVPPGTTIHQAELALAMTSLGSPPGHFLLVPLDPDARVSPYAQVIERLRWLFAGALDLIVLNLEAQVNGLPVEPREPSEDWAIVRRLIDVDGEGRRRSDSQVQGKNRRKVAGSRPVRGALLPRHPVVFCHGMLAFSMLKMQMPEDWNCFSPLRDFLGQRGVRVLFPQVLPTGGIVERAASLREQIRRWTDEPINLIAHSMGGLDARYMISRLGMADRVKSLTTVCTPHRGTYLANWFRDNFRNRVPLLLALETFGVNVNGFRDCQLAECEEFNRQTPDDPGVAYFSYVGEVAPWRLTPVLRRAWNILTPVEGPNDGMVSVASANWGQSLGTVHADHFAQTPDGAFVRPGENFDAVEFYSRMVEDLARRGF